MKPQTKQILLKIAKTAAITVIAALAIYAVIRLLPWFLSLRHEGPREEFREYVEALGIGGILLMLGIQILQILVAVLPGEPVEVLFGMMYGTFGGFLFCMVGILIGTVVIFYTVRILGKSLVERLFQKQEISRYKFLNDSHRLGAVLFILFFIPGTPKDILSYLAPLTRIKPAPFFAISLFARIPSVISSTFAGASLSDGDLAKTIVIFVVTGAIGMCGIIFHERIMNWLKRFRKPDPTTPGGE